MASTSHPRHIAVNGWMAGRLNSGSGQYLAHLLERLPGLAPAERVSLLIPAHPAMNGVDVSSTHKQWPALSVISVSLPALPENVAKVWWEQVAAPLAVQRLRADVYFVPYWAPPFWQPAPTVVTIHDLIPVLLPAYRGGRAQRAYTRLVSLTARRAAAILTVSNAAADDIVTHLGIPRDRVHVVHHGPNQEGVTRPDAGELADIKTRYALPERFFLYLGGFDVRKNVEGVINAYGRYLAAGGDPAVKLVLAGALPEEDTPFFPDPRRLAREAGCAEHVICCGWVDEADKPGIYARCTAFVFPSLYEGFGMMVLEAMQAGAPVITSSR